MNENSQSPGDEPTMGEFVKTIPHDDQWHRDIIPGFEVKWWGEFSLGDKKEHRG